MLGKSPAQEDGASAPLFQRSVIQESIRHRVEDLVRERGRNGSVFGEELNLAALDRLEHVAQSFDIQRFRKAVAQSLEDQRMVGNGNGLRDAIVLALRLRGKDGGQKIVRAHALERSRHALSPHGTEKRQRAREVPAPPRCKDGRRENGLLQAVFDPLGSQEPEDVFQREGVLRSQREIDPVVGRGGLQLEVKGPAEALAQGQSPGSIDAAAERRVQNQLRAPGLVKKTLRDDATDRRHAPEHALAFVDVGPALLCGPARESHFFREPPHALLPLRQTTVDLLAQRRHIRGELGRAGRRFAQPERNRGRLSPRVLHAHAPPFHAAHFPGRVPQQEDVAGKALDGEVLVDAPDIGAVGIGYDLIVCIIRDGAPARQSRQARPPAASQLPVNPIPVQIGGAPAEASGNPLRQHFDDPVEPGARQVAIRIGLAHRPEEILHVPITRAAHCHDLLRQNVERPGRNTQAVQIVMAHRVEERGAFDQLVARQGKESPLGNSPQPVTGAPDALQQNADRARRSDLAYQLDGPDVDPELQRSGSDTDSHLRLLQPLLSVEPCLARQAAVMGYHAFFAQLL